MLGIDQIASALHRVPVRGAVEAAQGTQAGEAGAVPFAGVFQAMVKQTGALEEKASQAVTGLMNGSGIEIHDAILATQRSGIAFEMALQVRNKAIGAYQQMMSMQF